MSAKERRNIKKEERKKGESQISITRLIRPIFIVKIYTFQFVYCSSPLPNLHQCRCYSGKRRLSHTIENERARERGEMCRGGVRKKYNKLLGEPSFN
jgi:hypothetical protein